jgi:hypothetical protein
MTPQRRAEPDWTPLNKGGSSYSTHRVVETRRGLVFVRTWRNWAWTAAGLLFAGTMVFAHVVVLALGRWLLGVLLLPFSLFLGAGALMTLFRRAIRFDAERREVTLEGRRIPFSEVRGLQLLGERVFEDETLDWDSYELNLVLRDGTRLNLVDHLSRGQLEREAQQLARLIDCEVLDEKESYARVRRPSS